jgi:hypothetical protein
MQPSTTSKATSKTTLREILGDDEHSHIVTLGYSGPTIGTDAPEANECNTLVIGPGNFQVGGAMSFPDFPSVVYSPKVHDFQVWESDILVRARGFRGPAGPVAAYVERDGINRAVRKRGFQGVVFNSNILRIRLRDAHNHAPGLDALFLAITINGPLGQRFFASRMQRSSVSGISRKDLLDFPIHLPSLDEQLALGRLHQLQVEHARVTNEISCHYNELFNAQLTRLSN